MQSFEQLQAKYSGEWKVLIVIFLVLAGLLFWWGLHLNQRAEYLVQNGISITGQVVSVTERTHRKSFDTYSRFWYTYVDQVGVEHTGFWDEYNDETATSMAASKEIPVVYDPENPKDHISGSDTENDGSSLEAAAAWIVSILIFLCAISIYFVMIKKRS